MKNLGCSGFNDLAVGPHFSFGLTILLNKLYLFDLCRKMPFVDSWLSFLCVSTPFIWFIKVGFMQLDHQAKEIAPAILNLSHSIKTAQNQAEFSAFQLTSLPSEFYQKDNLAEGKNHLPGVSSSKEDLLARSRNRNSKENGDSRFSKDTLWEYLEKRPSRQHNFSQAMRALDSIGRVRTFLRESSHNRDIRKWYAICAYNSVYLKNLPSSQSLSPLGIHSWMFVILILVWNKDAVYFF